MRFRETNVEVDAFEFVYSEAGIDLMQNFLGDALINYGKDRGLLSVGWMTIAGHHGELMHVHEGDYVVKKNEVFFPCKADDFKKKYMELSSNG